MDERNRSLPSCDSHSSYGNGGESARREEGENGRGHYCFFPNRHSSPHLLTSLPWEGTRSCLSFPEQPYLSGKVVTPPSLGEGILIGETDSDNLIL